MTETLPSGHASQLVRLRMFGCFPAGHAWHTDWSIFVTILLPIVVPSADTTNAQSWQIPTPEKRPAEQATQAVESAFGPVPASQLPHVVRASFTTAGELQAVHTPMTEYVAPAQGSHAEMSAFGCVPAAQAWHTAWSALATMLLPTAVLLGLLHVSHTAVPLLAVPAVQLVHSLSWLQPVGFQASPRPHELPAGQRNGRLHSVWSMFTTAGALQSWQIPKIEKRPAAQATQAVESAFGSVPGSHDVHAIEPCVVSNGSPTVVAVQGWQERL
jgi:hypothetical protein